MATLWETVTGNSTLPVQAGTTLWDHLNNQAGGGGGPTQYLVVEAHVESERQDIDVFVEPLAVEVEVVRADVLIEGEISAKVEVNRTETI